MPTITEKKREDEKDEEKEDGSGEAPSNAGDEAASDPESEERAEDQQRPAQGNEEVNDETMLSEVIEESLKRQAELDVNEAAEPTHDSKRQAIEDFEPAGSKRASSSLSAAPLYAGASKQLRLQNIALKTGGHLTRKKS